MIIRRAAADDLPAVTALIGEAAAWLAGRGVDQWRTPPGPDRIEVSIKAGDVWILRHADTPAATVTLDDYGDPEFWEPHAAGDALFMHRLAVARTHTGRGIGAALVEWCAEQAWQRGKWWLRWDAWKTNPGLLAYYRRLGAEHVRTVDLAHRSSGALFQVPARPMSVTARALIREA